MTPTEQIQSVKDAIVSAEATLNTLESKMSQTCLDLADLKSGIDLRELMIRGCERSITLIEELIEATKEDIKRIKRLLHGMQG